MQQAVFKMIQQGNVQFFLYVASIQCIHSYTVSQRSIQAENKNYSINMTIQQYPQKNQVQKLMIKGCMIICCLFLYRHVNRAYNFSFYMMCQYNNIQMLAQTLSLHLQGPLRKETILQIFNEFSPLRVAVRDTTLYVQITDPTNCADLMKKVKNGAFFDLKSQVFEILDSPANSEALLEKCRPIFANTVQVEDYFKINEHQNKQEPLKKEEEKEEPVYVQGIGLDEHVKIDLHGEFCQPSAKIELQFDQSPHKEVQSLPLFTPVKEESHKEVILEDFSEKSIPIVIRQQEREQTNNEATDHLGQKQRHFQKKHTEEKKKEPIRENPSPVPVKGASAPLKEYGARSTCLTIVLVLWIAWLII